MQGVSFILRARNEEAYLRQNLESLKALLIPHEIIVVLHQCTDGSEAIAKDAQERGQPIRIFKYNQSVSRAGYETVVTPHDHPASFVTYIRFCFAKARYNWLFKWDADFAATPSLIHFLNHELVLHEPSPIAYGIGCHLGDDVVNCEYYLFNCLQAHNKHVFWEVPQLHPEADKRLRRDLVISSIPPTVLKAYWRAPPWFETEDTEDAKAIRANMAKLIEICGPEPMASARASCPDNEVPWHSVINREQELKGEGIYLWH